MYCDLVIIRCFCCACVLRACEDALKPRPEVFAGMANWLKAKKEMPVKPRERPIKTRRLKNAECELDFFFIVENSGGSNLSNRMGFN